MPRKPLLSQWIFAVLVAICGFGMLTLQTFWPDSLEPAWERLLTGIFIGPLCGFGLMELMRVIRMRQMWGAVRHLPREFTLEEQVDGSLVAFVTRLDGEPRLIRLPEDYDPREDQGRQLFELMQEPE